MATKKPCILGLKQVLTTLLQCTKTCAIEVLGVTVGEDIYLNVH